MSIGLAAILINGMHDITQSHRDSMKPTLGNLAILGNYVSPNAPLLFGYYTIVSCQGTHPSSEEK